MFETLVWWVVVQLVGVLALPLTFLFFARLPDRGYAFGKPLGILVLSYVLWLGGLARVVPNSRGSIVALLVVFLVASLLLLSRCREELFAFLRRNWTIVLLEEGIFLAAFILWAVVRSYNPEIRTTEQPMDFGFMNAIYRSEFFPPNDPWLAGHSISYYYFGYLMMATLAKLSGLATSVAYNLSLSMLFGLVAASAFSIGFNLVALRGPSGRPATSVGASFWRRTPLHRPGTGPVDGDPDAGRGAPGRPPQNRSVAATVALEGRPQRRKTATTGAEGRPEVSEATTAPGLAGHQPYRRQKPAGTGLAPIIAGLLGALFVVGIGNLEGALELLRAHSLGTPDLWRWIGIKDAFQPYASTQWYPTENWWWWRATRVINSLVITLNPQGGVAGVSDRDYTITEFPFFSFLLGDMHPHVMALPFGLLAIALSLNVLRQGKDLLLYLPRPSQGGITISDVWQALGDWLRANGSRLGLAAIILGSLGFLNSWDFPTQTLLFLASAAAGMFLVRRALTLDLLLSVVALAVAVGIGGVLLYLPFYVGFQSQASGILPVLGPGTQFLHFAIVLGPFLVALAAFLLVLATQVFASGRTGSRWASAVASCWPVLAVLALVAIWALIVVGASATGSLKAESLGSFFAGRALRLLPVVAAAVAALYMLNAWLRSRTKSGVDRSAWSRETDIGVIFALLLATVGFALALGCELFFVRDVFGTRMNTVFKLYYQAWILLALASAYGLYYVSRRLLRGGWKPVGFTLLGLVGVLLMGALVYPVASVFSKTNSFAGPPALDGTAYVKRENPGEHQAIQWLMDNAPAGSVVVEATGGQYSEYARVATRTGLPTILGWAGHEWQWRGSDKAYVGRAEDLDTIYRSVDRAQVLTLLAKYKATYVYAGHLERSKYGQPALDRFAAFMDTVFRNETTAIYKVRR